MNNQEIKSELLSLSEPDFREFTKKLMPGVEHVMGVRLPNLRKVAKKIRKNGWREYLEQATDDTYEEIMLQGFVIGGELEDWETAASLIAGFVPKIDNWSVCDSFCSSLKITKNHPEKMRDFLLPYLQSCKEFEARFGVVMLLNYYVDADYIHTTLKALSKVSQEGYYARMAVAWALSICYIRFPDETMDYLRRSQLDDYTYNKALQKITESLTIDSNTKKMIRGMRRR